MKYMYVLYKYLYNTVYLGTHIVLYHIVILCTSPRLGNNLLSKHVYTIDGNIIIRQSKFFFILYELMKYLLLVIIIVRCRNHESLP